MAPVLDELAQQGVVVSVPDRSPSPRVTSWASDSSALGTIPPSMRLRGMTSRPNTVSLRCRARVKTWVL